MVDDVSERIRQFSPRVCIFITIFVDMLGYGIVIPLLPLYVEQYSAGGTLVGVLGSCYALVQSIGGPLLSSLSDRYGRRPILLFSLLGTSLAYTLLGLADTLWLLVAALLLDGITGGNISTAQAYIADITSPEERSRGFVLTGAAFGLGMVAGPALSGMLSQYTLSTPAFVAAALACSNFFFGLALLPESLSPEHRAHHQPKQHVFREFVEVVRPVQLRHLLLTLLLLNLAFAGLQSNFPIFSRARFGWDASANAFFYAFVGVCAVVVQGVLLGGLRQRFGEARLAIAGLALMSVNLALVAVAWQSWMLYPVVGLLALGSNLSIPCLSSLISARVAPGSQGRLMGSMQIVLNVALIGGPLLAGLSFDYLGIAAPYALGSLIALLALVVGVGAVRESG